MRSIEEMQVVLGLLDDGHNHSEIARRTGIPRRTVIGWSQGELPRTFRDLGQGITACPACGWPQHDYDELPGANYAYLLGLYLGDGYIAHAPRGVFCLRIFLDRRYGGIVDECRRAMQAVMPSNKIGIVHDRSAYLDKVQCYSKQWPCLFPQHGPGLKHLRRIQLSDWQLSITREHPEPLLRGLIHSDGYRGMNIIKHPKKTYSYPRYQFCNRSEDIRQIFCEHLDLIGVEWRVMNRWNISVARRDSVAKLDRFIGPKL